MKILLWDIETSPMVVTAWALWDQNISHENILKESGIISVAWKWLGEKKVSAVAVKASDPDNDEQVVLTMHRVLSSADILVAHYGDKFDLPKFNARIIKYGLPPLPPIPTVDTKKVASKHFKFNSNKLDYLGKYLGLGKKIPTTYSLWLKIMNGDEEALRRMVRYNKQDVVLLEKVYLKLRPFMHNHPNENLHVEVECCPACGSNDFRKKGFKAQRTTIRQQYQCNSCGSWFCGKLIKTAVMK